MVGLDRAVFPCDNNIRRNQDLHLSYELIYLDRLIACLDWSHVKIHCTLIQITQDKLIKKDTLCRREVGFFLSKIRYHGSKNKRKMASLLLTPIHHTNLDVFGFYNLNFRTSTPEKVTESLHAGIARLTTCFNFLAGEMVPSTKFPGKKNVWEVRPSTMASGTDHPIANIPYLFFSFSSSLRRSSRLTR